MLGRCAVETVADDQDVIERSTCISTVILTDVPVITRERRVSLRQNKISPGEIGAGRYPLSRAFTRSFLTPPRRARLS